MRHIGSQPILVAASALAMIVIGLGSVAAWRAYTGTAPEQDRVTSARVLQARTAQVTEELVEKTKGLERSQQETIDQVQAVAEQLQVVKRLLTAQQAEAKRLNEQVGGVAQSMDTLRQSFATERDNEVSTRPAKKRLVRRSPRAGKSNKRAKSLSR